MRVPRNTRPPEKKNAGPAHEGLRVATLGVAGAALGAALVYLTFGPPAADDAQSAAPARQHLPELYSAPRSDEGRRNLSPMAAAYRQAADAVYAADLESLIALAAAAPDGRMRALELDALLARLAAIDVQRAVDLAQSLHLELRFLVPLFQDWAGVDSDAALRALAEVRRPAQRRALAIALLEVFGLDARGIALVSSALPGAERFVFEIDAMIVHGQEDPGASLQHLAALPAGAAALAAGRWAEQAGRTDPAIALAHASSVANPELRSALRSGVLTSWAAIDPDAVFNHLDDAAAAEVPASPRAFNALAAADSERLMAIAEHWPPALRRSATQAVLLALAERDPASALAQLERLPQGPDYLALTTTVAGAWGREDPVAALAWARATSPQAIDAVIRTIAETDINAALELALAEIAEPTTVGGDGLHGVRIGLALTLASDSGDPSKLADLADRLQAAPATRSAIETVVPLWAMRHPEEALDWALTNVNSIEPSVFDAVAQTYAATRPQQAMDMLSRLPAALHEGWVAGALQGMARSDPAAAAEWLGQVIDPDQRVAAANTIAFAWARQDPAGAAAWIVNGHSNGTASGLSPQVFQQTAAAWARTDRNAARDWTLALPHGPSRSAALSGYLDSAARDGTLDADVLGAFGNARDRQLAAMRAIEQIGLRDAARARRLIAQHIVDPGMRRMAEDRLARQSGSVGR